jgi:hypothetical protein
MTIPGRGWAYLGAGLGGAVSIAANVAHSYVPPAGAPAGWAPELGAVVGAIFWPVALFVAVEIIARVAWPAGRRWVALRFLGLLPVALVAAGVSYAHLSGLLAFYGEPAVTAYAGPLAVDGLMVMATGALIATGRARRGDVPPKGTVIVTAGSVDEWAAAAGQSPNGPVPATEPATAAAKAAPTARRGGRPSAADRVAKAARRTPGASDAQIAARLSLSEKTVRRHRTAGSGDKTPAAEATPEQASREPATVGSAL